MNSLQESLFALPYQERYTPDEVGSLFGCTGQAIRDIANEGRHGGLPLCRSSLTGNYWISYDRLVLFLRSQTGPMRLLVRHVEPAPLPLRS
jgi:hypothetical protein